jgi:MerR family transcriptional regulator, thiopeptide resistance regulator
MSERFLSPSEAARRLGVGVRALRLYERKGLVRPRRTQAGWRVYGPGEIERLHQVLTLKSLGLSLTRITQLLGGREPDLTALLALQEDVLTVRINDLQRARKSVQAARAKLLSEGRLSLEDLIDLVRETVMTKPFSDEEWNALFEPFYRKHLSPEQYATIVSPEVKARGLKRLGMTDAEYDDAWRSVIADATKLMRRCDDASPEAQDVLRRWVRLSEVFSNGDLTLQAGVFAALYSGLKDPSVAAKSPISEALLAFMHQIRNREFIASLPEPADERPDRKPHPSDAAVRTLIDSLVDGSFASQAKPEIGDDEDAQLRRAHFAALGPVTSLHHLRSDDRGDIHRATFTGGRMLCTTRRDETGKITFFELVPG